MALIIKGKMPEGNGCDGCEFQVSKSEQLDACTCHLFIGVINNFHNERHKDCPIIGEIPDKHGDLIDRDKASTQIIAEICQFCANAENGNCDGCLVQKCLEAIGRVPTIVEATE